MSRPFPAKYAGRCADCGMPFPEQAMITYDGKAHHSTPSACADAIKARNDANAGRPYVPSPRIRPFTALSEREKLLKIIETWRSIYISPAMVAELVAHDEDIMHFVEDNEYFDGEKEILEEAVAQRYRNRMIQQFSDALDEFDKAETAHRDAERFVNGR